MNGIVKVLATIVIVIDNVIPVDRNQVMYVQKNYFRVGDFYSMAFLNMASKQLTISACLIKVPCRKKSFCNKILA